MDKNAPRQSTGKKLMTQPSDLLTIPQSWRSGGWRLALNLGVASLEKPLFRRSIDSLDPCDHIRLAADLGFAGITDNMLKARPPAVQSAMGEELAKLGLVMGSFTNAPLGTGDPLWGDPDPSKDDAFFTSIEASIVTGKRTGGSVITMIVARAPGIEFHLQMRVFAERARKVADRVADAGMVLAIEPTSVSRLPTFLIHHIAEVREIIGPDRHPGLKLMFDTAHVHEMDGDPVTAYLSAQDITTDIVQLANIRDRLDPGSGQTDFTAFFRCLTKLDFSGLVELEYYLREDTAAAERDALQALADILTAL